MPALPDGEPAPADGMLPADRDWQRPFRAYVHVPFCRHRCGYCDFNTYTPRELGGMDIESYLLAVEREIHLAREVSDPPEISSIFFGGGTPSLLTGAQLQRIITRLSDSFGLAVTAEVTMEANPENVSSANLQGWLAAGVTRLSLGMQSDDTAALRLLDRVHTPGSAVRAAREAKDEGFEHVSLDLIYGIPGQSDHSWQRTVAAALDAGPDHISAYALGVEPGTALFRKTEQGRVPPTDPDVAAGQYEIVDTMLAAAGMPWYEISNWAAVGGQCQHNLGYWHGDNWWGFGPGAHSHVDGVRWWNVKRPSAYQAVLAAGNSPAAGREVLGEQEQRVEQTMLQVRLAQGFNAPEPARSELIAAGLAENGDGARLHLTRKGRMLADAVTRVLLGWD